MFGSILTAMVTPFNDTLAVDYDRLAELAEFLIDNGSDGLVVAGTTGESPTLSDDEKVRMFRCVVEAVAGRAKVIAGSGSNDTAHSVELTGRAQDCGVDGVLIVTPYYNRPPERGLKAHFRAVAAATALPLIMYNIPSRCGVNLSPEVLAELGEIENIVAVKQANPDLAESRRLREISSLGLYAGNDDMLVDLLEIGGRGGICVSSHVAGPQMRLVITAAGNGDMALARELDAKLASLYRTLFLTANPILVKSALNQLGHAVGGLRLPLVPATAAEAAIVAAELRAQGILS